MIHSLAMKIGSRRQNQLAVWGALVVAIGAATAGAAGPANPRPVASSVATPPPPSREPLAAARKRASEAQQTLVVEFSADWCSPCKQFERDVLPKESVRVALAKVQFVRFDAETDVGRDAVKLLQVEGYPTFVALRTDGEVASVLQGAQTEVEFVRWLRLMAIDFEPRERLLSRIRNHPSDGEAMLLWALRLRKRGELNEAAEWLDKARLAKGSSAEVAARADWELRRLRLRLLLPRQQLIEHLTLYPSGPQSDEAMRALLRLGTPDSATQVVLGRYLDGLLQPASSERINQMIYRLLRAQAFTEADRAARYLLSLDSKSPYYLDTLAEVCHLRGEPKEALRLSAQALASPLIKDSEQLRQSLSANQARFARARREPPAELAAPDDELQPWEHD